MNSASVSVIIPTYNSGHMVTEAIDSVLAQTVVPAEIIVLDDGSKDNTGERLARYGRQIRYIYQQNQGVAATRNRGMQEARGEYIAFLDADDVWHPRKLELQLAALARDERIALLGTLSFAWPRPQLPPLADPTTAGLRFVPWERLVVKNSIVTSSVLVCRAVLRRVGLFDPSLRCSSDYDLWLRIAEAARVATLDLPLTGYRDVPESLSKQARAVEEAMQRILRKLDERNAWAGRRLLRRKAYGYVHHSCAYVYGAAGHHGTALLRSIQSLSLYPLPYRRDEVLTPLERPKRLLMNLLRLFRLA